MYRLPSLFILDNSYTSPTSSALTMEPDTHDLFSEDPEVICKYIKTKSMMSTQAIVTPRNETTGPGGLPNFKFPSKSHPDGPRSQTLEPELAAGLYETNLLEVSATLRPSVSPPHVAPAVEGPEQAPDQAYVAFQERLATVSHPGGANTVILRNNMMVNTDWVAGFRDFKKLRVSILEKMGPALRSFLLAAPVDMSAMPTYVLDSMAAHFEVDFLDLKLLYLQAFTSKGRKTSPAS